MKKIPDSFVMWLCVILAGALMLALIGGFLLPLFILIAKDMWQAALN